MYHDHRPVDAHQERIISKTMHRLRQWMNREMHRCRPDTDKLWRVQQRCRRYEEQLNALSDSTHTQH